MKILIAGGSGLIGQSLQNAFTKRDNEVRVLSRKAQDPVYRWDPALMQMALQAEAWADALINLTGAGVADHRWTPEYKKVLYDSRINSTRLLQKALEELQDTENKQIVQASAIGYYANSDEWVDETSRNGDGFLAELCS